MFGFSTKKEKQSIRDNAVLSVAKQLDAYKDEYHNRGLYLPPDFARDPSGWQTVLEKMNRAFVLLELEKRGEGEYWEAKNKWKKWGINEVDEDDIAEIEEAIQEGLTLFGKYLFWLTDTSLD